MFGLVQHVRGMEQRLGRDAPDVEAGAAQRFTALDHGGLEPELRAADGADIAAGAAADDDHVIVGHELGPFVEGGEGASPLLRLRRNSPPEYLKPEEGSQKRPHQHDERRGKADDPDIGAPWGQPEGVGGHVKHACAEVDPPANRGQGRRLAGKRDNNHSNGEQRQPLEMIGHRPLKASCDAREYARFVAWPQRIFRPDLPLRSDRVEHELPHLEQGGEGEGGEFVGHAIASERDLLAWIMFCARACALIGTFP